MDLLGMNLKIVVEQRLSFKEGMFKLLDVRTGKEVWNNLFDCIENCNVFLQGNIYETQSFWRIRNETKKIPVQWC